MFAQSDPLDHLVTAVQHASQRHRDNLVATDACGCRSRCLACGLRLAGSSDQLLAALERLELAQEEHDRAVHGR